METTPQVFGHREYRPLTDAIRAGVLIFGCLVGLSLAFGLPALTMLESEGSVTLGMCFGLVYLLLLKRCVARKSETAKEDVFDDPLVASYSLALIIASLYILLLRSGISTRESALWMLALAGLAFESSVAIGILYLEKMVVGNKIRVVRARTSDIMALLFAVSFVIIAAFLS
ncbi:hypothetical protein HZA56_14870 [Candidatus Poribacteria bacterium]|nr:hypothetical protein [Candidatus Poribacteria bacterium]